MVNKGNASIPVRRRLEVLGFAPGAADAGWPEPSRPADRRVLRDRDDNDGDVGRVCRVDRMMLDGSLPSWYPRG